jgi:hypothetical protein
MHTPNPDIPNIPDTPELVMPLCSGPALPLVLFPIRLETRFFPHADGGSELRVRVYPDQVHIDSHEPELSPEELTWGRHFWEQSWLAGNDEERRKTAWRQLADRFDPPRAAWIARALKPLNPEDQPLSKPPRFPALEQRLEDRPPTARVLPNQWIVLGYQNGQLIVNVRGGPIREPLAVGPDPSPSTEADSSVIDEGIRWIVDFVEAERVGMGIRAHLNQEQAAAGLDFLLVMGIRDTPGQSVDWTSRLAELFDAHHYTNGLAFVPQGTPSNNTADAPSGFRSNDPGHEASYLAERTAPAFEAGDGSNADLLTTAFGLSHAGPVFANLPNAGAKEQLDAYHMNTALWQATWGYFLLQMIGVRETSESPLKDEDIACLRSHFIDYVRASGPLPCLRVGKQPYGVLPVTSLDAWKPPAGHEAEFRRDAVLRDFLIRLRGLWRRNVSEVPRLGRSDADIDKDLAEVLSMEGLSSSYWLRNLIGRHYWEHLFVFLSADALLDFWAIPVMEELPPEPQPLPDPEPPDPDLTPAQRREWIRQQKEKMNTYRQELAEWRAKVAARKGLLVAIEAKRRDISAWWEEQERQTGIVLQTLGLTWRPRLAHAVFGQPVASVSGALVQAEPGTSLSPNYIESLLGASDIEAIQKESPSQPAPRTLLYLLLRHSMLLEYEAAASRLLISRGLLQAAQRREPELVNLQLGRPTRTVWDLLKIKIGEAEPMEVQKYLFPQGPTGETTVPNDPELKPLSEFRASLAYLKGLDPARLEQLLTGTLDLCSHRLDAWITSLATKRLTEMRKVNPAGVLFGGYGWVMNLRPGDPQTPVATPTGEEGPVFESARNAGFIHTPSLAQASTAAILRSGHLAHAASQPNGPLAIDLSSQRVRLASWLLDGVRQGQPLGALLGYRFERRLQEARDPLLAQFIAPFRELAPLVARKLEQTTEAVENIAANNVVDGLMLHNLWQQTQTDPLQRVQREQDFFSKLPQMTDEEKQKIRLELVALIDSVDAVSDALLAESVHQVVRGNPLRAASTAEAIAGGETPPPELDVVRTPRTGIALTHRLVTLFSGEPRLPAEWASIQSSVRAEAEPHLNAWVAKLLGNPSSVRGTVEHLDPATGTVTETKEFRLDQVLAIAPLDFVYAIEGGQGGQQAEIEQRILYTIQRESGGFPPSSLLRINPSRRPEWKTSELSYGEFSEVLRTVRRLVNGVRGIDPDDLDLPERSTPFSVDIDDLEKRAVGAEQALIQITQDLQTRLETPDTINLDALRDSLIRSTSFGLAGAVPLSATDGIEADRQTLLAQAGSVQKELVQRIEQLEALAAGFDGAPEKTPEAKRDYALARLRTTLGKAFVVLPRFVPGNADELANTLARSTALQDGDPFAALTWFQRMARVREGVGRLSDVLAYSEALGAGEKLALTVAQLPHGSADRWAALPLQGSQSLPGGRLSLVVQSTTPIDVAKPVAGLLVDEWVEIVPSATETTGIALQYDQPNAAPPQSILLAVPPELESPWTVWSLQQVLLETLDLARIRAVDPDALDEIGHYLPALYFAHNPAGDTISPDFTKIN